MISSVESASSPRELLVLLKGSAKSGGLATDALLNALADCDGSEGQLLGELRAVLHELCTGTLLSANWTARANGGCALHAIFKRFDFLLSPLLQHSASDGDLLLLNELDVRAVAALGEASELRNGSAGEESAPSNSSDDLYKKGWLKRQRGALLKRLGLSAVEGAVSAEEIVTSELLDWSDLCQLGGSGAGAAKSSSSSRESKNGGASRKKARVSRNEEQRDQGGGSSEESWLARLVRFMVVGLLDPRWETRHGCSQGLTALTSALYGADGCGARLPPFLVEDVVCSSLCVLVLDRFLDFGAGISATQPVKEAAGQLVACASRFCRAAQVRSVFSKLLVLCTFGEGEAAASGVRVGRGSAAAVSSPAPAASALAVRIGGFAALKYTLPLHFAAISGRCLQSVAEVAARSLLEHSDELNGAAAQLLRCFQHLQLSQQGGFDFAATAAAMCAGLLSSAQRLGSLDSRADALCLALEAVAAALRSQGVRSRRVLDVAAVVIDACSEVLLSLDLYTDQVRRRCLQLLLRAIGSLGVLLRSCDVEGAAIACSAARLATALLLSLSLRPSKSLGDLFLVSRAAQQAAPSEGVQRLSVEIASSVDEYDDVGAVLATFLLAALSAFPACVCRGVHDVARELIAYIVLWQGGAGAADTDAAELEAVVDDTLQRGLRRHIDDNSDFRRGSGGEQALEAFYLCSSRACRTRLARVLADATFAVEASRRFESNPVLLLCPAAGGGEGGSGVGWLVERAQARLAECLRSLAAPAPARKPAAAGSRPRPRFQISFVADCAEGGGTAAAGGGGDVFSKSSAARKGADLLLMLLCALAGRFALYGSCGAEMRGACRGFVESSDLLVQEGSRSGVDAPCVASLRTLLHCYARAAAGDTMGVLAGLVASSSQSARALLVGTCSNLLLQLVEVHMVGGDEGAAVAQAMDQLLRAADGGDSAARDVLKCISAKLQANFFRYCVPVREFLGEERACARYVLLLEVVRQLGARAALALVEDGVVTSLVGELLRAGDAAGAAALEAAASTCCALRAACAEESSKELVVAQAAGCLAAADDAARCTLAQLLLLLVRGLEEGVLCCYDELLQLSLSLLADNDPLCRRSATACVRQLVPLAPIARDRLRRAHRAATEGGGGAASSARDLLLHARPPPLSPSIERLLADRGVSLLSTGDAGDTRLSLRGYQREGVRWLSQLRCSRLGGILADDMGLGKTVQALCLVAVARAEAAVGAGLPSLVVCPSSLVASWHAEVLKFFPTLEGQTEPLLEPVLFGSGASGASWSEHAVVIVSFSELRQHVALLSSRVFEVVIVDEAHIIKNSATAVAQAVFQLRSRSMRVALSGTPVQNSVDELWSLMHFVMPDYLGTREAFTADFARPIKRSFVQRQQLLGGGGGGGGASQGIIDVSAEGVHLLQRLHRLVLPFVLRRTKETVAPELPQKTVVDVLCPLSQLQRAMYRDFQRGAGTTDEALEAQLRALLSSEQRPRPEPEGRLHPLRALAYLKLLSVHPALVVGASHGAYRRRLVAEHGCSGKLHLLARLLLDAGVALREECVGADALYEEDAGPAGGDYGEGRKEEEEEAPAGASCSRPHARAVVLGMQPTRSSSRLQLQRQAQPDPPLPPLPQRSGSGNRHVHRCLLFAQHRATLDMVEACVLRRFFPTVAYLRLDGSTAPAARAALAARFNEQSSCGEDIRLLLVTTKACGLGLTLVAADTAIFLEHDWNPYVDLQAQDRIHRIGQTRPVTIYRLLADSTVEARIMGLQGVKRAVAGEVVNEGNAAAAAGERALQPALWSSLQLSAGSGGGAEGAADDEEAMDLDRFLVAVGCG